MKILELLKQRRIWASISASLYVILTLMGYTGEFNAEAFTDTIMTVINAVSAVSAIILPIWSYYKPKK